MMMNVEIHCNAKSHNNCTSNPMILPASSVAANTVINDVFKGKLPPFYVSVLLFF